MAKNDNFFKQKEIELQEKLNQLKKEQAEIEKKMAVQSRINGTTQQKYAERAEKIKKIEAERKVYSEEIAKENERAWKSLTKKETVNKKLLTEEKLSRSLAKDMTKLLDTQKGKILERAGVISGQNAAALKIEKQKILEQLRSGELTDQESARKEKVLQTINATGDLQRDILNDFEAETLDSISREEIKQKVLEKAGITQSEFNKLNEKEQKLIKKQITDIHDSVEILTEEGFKEMVDEVGAIEDQLDPLIKKTKAWGNILQDSKLRMTALKGGIAAIAISFAKGVFDNAKEVRQELGLSVGQAAVLGAKLSVAEKALTVMGGKSGEVKAFATGIAQEFGNVQELSTGVALQFAKISASTGISGDNAAKLAKSLQTIQGGSLETSLNTLEAWGNLAKAEGVSQKLVLDDVAKSTDDFARFAKDGGDNIIKAAIGASKLGLELADVAKISDSLLDIESSITNEMEAEMLIGKQLNLDKARELALAGELDKLQEEITNGLVSQAEWSEMNVVQRDALAKAIGVSVGDMGKMIAGEKTSAMLAEEKAAKEKQHMDTMTVLMGIQASAAVAAATPTIAGAIASIWKTFAGLPFGLGIPAAITATAGLYGAITKGKSLVGLQEGGVVKETGMAEVHKGEVFSGDKNQMGFGASMTETNGLIRKHIAESKQLREQNELLMNKLIRTTGDLQLANA